MHPPPPQAGTKRPRSPGSLRLFGTRTLARYLIPLRTLTVLLVLFSLLRVALLLTHVDRPDLSPALLARVILTGFRFDLLIALLILLPQIAHLSLCPPARLVSRFSRFSIHLGLLVTFAAAVLLCLTEWLFFDEFQSRLNYIAFEYLIYPSEVATNIWQSYPLPALVAAVLAFAALLYWPMRRSTTALLFIELPLKRRLTVFASVFACIALLSATSGMSSMRLSRNRVANECAGNGLYTFAYYAWTNRFDFDDFYLTDDLLDAFGRVAARITRPTDRPAHNSPSPLERTVHTEQPRRDWNVVVILEESLGSDFVGVLGDTRNLTPHFDALSRDGLLLDHFFATGNRTARAVEAVLTSIPPIPTEAILKRDHSENVHTLARILESRGYQRRFIYGGRGLFDGMRSFTLANGFERFIEYADFENPTFTTAWGVCDEDIFDKAIPEFDRMHNAGRPFFSVVLTVSNHRPYTYPDGRIDRPSSQQLRANAVKYADHALGRFFEQARSHPFFDRTLFVVMGDHGARIYGSQMFPLKSYRVPVLIIRPDHADAGRRCSTLASSLDIAPTIMGLLGGSYRSVFFGRDCLHLEPADGYALMQHNRDVALLDSTGRLLVLGCPKTSAMYQLNPTTWQLQKRPAPDPAMQHETIAFYQTANRLYYERRYVLADPAAAPTTAQR